jgi:thiol-disulfide isomerase/thioredoxin
MLRPSLPGRKNSTSFFPSNSSEKPLPSFQQFARISQQGSRIIATTLSRHFPRQQIFRRFLFAGILCLCPLAIRAQTSPPTELSFTDLSGKSHSFSDYHGKIVVLNFWATWCLPCRDEMPMLSKLSKDFASQNVVFLAVSLDDAKSQSKIPRFLEKKKITLSVFTGATPATLHEFQLGEIVPATIILDRDGSPVFRIMGQASKKDISSRLDWLLSDRSSKSPKPLLKNF